jgi:hypothetical protein
MRILFCKRDEREISPADSQYPITPHVTSQQTADTVEKVCIGSASHQVILLVSARPPLDSVIILFV